MGTTLADLYTAGGHRLDEAASAMQKCIRRGMELEAVYWAQEVESRFYNFVWKRLIVIAYEDIGIADPMAALYVGQAHRHYMEFREEKQEILDLALIAAVQYLCRAPKSRIADHLHVVVYCSDLTFDVPDFAYDMHTRQGRQMGRGIPHFYEDGAVIHPDAGFNEYEAEAIRIDEDPQERIWFTEAKKKLKNGVKKKREERRAKEAKPSQGNLFDE